MIAWAPMIQTTASAHSGTGDEKDGEGQRGNATETKEPLSGDVMP
ncbi:MAG TPA: hypothetical protein VFS96_04100 [Nitrolancea sp.]|nr:hypothetical protein [Nitrolancea sp.]